MEIRDLIKTLYRPIARLMSSAPADGPKSRSRELWPALAFCFLSFFLAAQPAEAQIAEQVRLQMEGELDSIKDEFEEQLTGLSDHRQIAALAIKAGGKAWMTSAFVVNQKDNPFDLNAKFKAFDAQWDKAKGSWPIREQLALKFYYEAASRIIVPVALTAHDNEALKDLRALISSSHQHPKSKNESAQLAENKVLWSNRICALVTIMAKLKNPHQSAELDDIVEDMLNRAEIVARRTDIHYQAKMELLYLNNSQSITSMLFLLAKSEKSPIVSQAENMETAWHLYAGEMGSPVPDQMSFTWVTNTQITFPMAWWLATDTSLQH
jgi:hypothetical protein